MIILQTDSRLRLHHKDCLCIFLRATELVFLFFFRSIYQLSLEAQEQTQTVDTSPLGKEKLLSLWENWKKQVLEKYQRRNEHLYDREVDRINRYYQDYSLRVDDRIKKSEVEKEDLNRRRDNSADLTERRGLHKKIQEIELRLDRLRLEQIKLKQEANQLKRKDYEELEKKFELKTEEELIAVTLFKVV